MVMILAERAAERPDETALRDERVSLGWREVNDTVNRIAETLAPLVLDPERRVAVCAENSAELAMTYLGITYGGCSAVPISIHLTASEIAYILADCGARVLIVGPETAAVGLEAARLAGLPTVVGFRSEAQPGLTDWSDWLSDAAPVEPPLDRAVRNSLMYTSGTTGFPKGVELMPPYAARGGDTVAQYAEVLRTEPLAARGIHLVVGPMYHTGPIRSVRVLGAGVPVVVRSHFDAVGVLDAIERYRITTCLLVPTHFVRLLALPEDVRRGYDISSLTFVVQTGSACPIQVKREMIEWWGPIFQEGYGSTESRMVCTISSAEWLRKPGSVGRVVPPFTRAVAVDGDGQYLPAGAVGTLYFVDSTGRGIEYRGDPEKSRAAHLEPGVFTLGEVGYVDDDGYVFITDRISDMIVSGGVNIYPAEAEMVLSAHPGVADVIVIGVPDSSYGEAVRALVVLAEQPDPPTSAELIAYCKAHLASYKCPRTVEFVDALERSPMGKVAKHKIRARYWPAQVAG